MTSLKRKRQGATPDAKKIAKLAFDTYSFAIDDYEKWIKHLDEQGYVVISNVLNQQQVSTSFEYIWQFLESLNTGINREDPSTWDNDSWPYKFTNGIVSYYGIGQADITWYVRLIPAVKQVFQKIWFGNEEPSPLLVSFDGINLFRPFSVNSKWKTSTQKWAHVDQNPFSQKGKHAIQGMVNLIDSSDVDGGFVCIPKSHHLFEQLETLGIGKDQPTKKYFSLEELDEAKKLYEDMPIHKVNANAGDLILWDSRTVHWNCPPSTKKPLDVNQLSKGLIRAGVYVCMTPASKIPASKMDIVIKRRKEGVKTGATTNHWPHFYDPNGPGRYTRKHYGHKEIPKDKHANPSTLAQTPEAVNLISGL